MDVSIYYYGTAGSLHPPKPLWLRQADVVLETPSRAMLVDAIRAAATHVGINAPISEVIVILVWTGANGKVQVVGGRPRPRPEPEEGEEEPAPARRSVMSHTPVTLRMPVYSAFAVPQPPSSAPSWLGATYSNGQNYVSRYYHGGVPSSMSARGPLSAVYHHGSNYVGDWYGTGGWSGYQQPHVYGQSIIVADMPAEIIYERPVSDVSRRSARRPASTVQPAEPVESARIEVAGEVSRERLTDMAEDSLGRLEATAGTGVLELHVLVDVDGMGWGGEIPPVRVTQEPLMTGALRPEDSASQQVTREASRLGSRAASRVGSGGSGGRSVADRSVANGSNTGRSAAVGSVADRSVADRSVAGEEEEIV